MSNNLSNKREKLVSKVARIANSAMAFLIAYLCIMFFFYISTALMGKMFGFDAHVYYYGVKFELGRHKWTQSNIFFVWSFGTLFTALLGGLCSYLFYRLRGTVLLGNLIFLWAVVICFSIVAAQGLLPCLQPGEYFSPFYKNLSVIFAWLDLPMIVSYLVCIVFSLFLIFFSIYTSKPFLAFSYSFSKVNKRDRKRKYYFETVIIPFLIAGSVVLIFIHQTYQVPNFVILNILYLCTIAVSLFISFLVININDMKTDDVLRYKNLQQINPVFFIILMFLLMFFSVTYRGFYLPF